MIKTSFLHIGVTCNNPAKFEDFYSEYFGFKRVKSVLLDNNKELIFLKDDNNFCFEVFPMDEERPVPQAEGDGPHYPGWRHIAFIVENVDTKLVEMGNDAVITLGPITLDEYTKGWKAVWIKDPEGNIIEICQGYKDE
ncbi:MAG: VOC family protein [Bacteroidota bacterium]